MQHKHFETIDSTQIYLYDHVKNYSTNENFIVTTNNQVKGHGRRGTAWSHFENAIACSFILNPADPLSLTSLEIGFIVGEFINEKFQKKLKLKWPNDLYNNLNKKVGGIICQQVNGIIVVGLGLNIGSLNHNKYGFIIKKEFEKIELTKLAKEIYSYLLKNRISPSKLISKWENNCLHLGKMVSIEQQSGIFKGLGKNGEAILEINGNQKSFYTGSLTLPQDLL